MSKKVEITRKGSTTHYKLINNTPSIAPLSNEKHRNSPIIDHLSRYQKAYTSILVASSVLLYPITGMAATEAEEMLGGRNIILLLQKASFYVGMGITIWGIVEAMLDFPGWKGRITKGILGYIGILLVPLVFVELQNSLHVDVWNQIDGSKFP